MVPLFQRTPARVSEKITYTEHAQNTVIDAVKNIVHSNNPSQELGNRELENCVRNASLISPSGNTDNTGTTFRAILFAFSS